MGGIIPLFKGWQNRKNRLALLHIPLLSSPPIHLQFPFPSSPIIFSLFITLFISSHIALISTLNHQNLQEQLFHANSLSAYFHYSLKSHFCIISPLLNFTFSPNFIKIQHRIFHTLTFLQLPSPVTTLLTILSPSTPLTTFLPLYIHVSIYVYNPLIL